MGNQQPSDLEGLLTLAKNAKLGDGYFWRHPECVNSKIIYTSTDKGLLEAKMNLFPNIFTSGVGVQREANEGTNFGNNSKKLYRLASIVHPLFTEYHSKSKIEVFEEFNEFDFALWYLDDGCTIKREEYKNSINYRFMICIGETATGNEERFLNKIKDMFSHIKTRSGTIGSIVKNNSKATEKNKTWIIPVPIGKYILKMATNFYFMQNKVPYAKGPEVIPKGSRRIGLNSSSKRQLRFF